jgi:hypothetical protein
MSDFASPWNPRRAGQPVKPARSGGGPQLPGDRGHCPSIPRTSCPPEGVLRQARLSIPTKNPGPEPAGDSAFLADGRKPGAGRLRCATHAAGISQRAPSTRAESGRVGQPSTRGAARRVQTQSCECRPAGAAGGRHAGRIHRHSSRAFNAHRTADHALQPRRPAHCGESRGRRKPRPCGETVRIGGLRRAATPAIRRRSPSRHSRARRGRWTAGGCRQCRHCAG